MVSKAAFLLVALTNILYVRCAPSTSEGVINGGLWVALELEPTRSPYQNSILRQRRDNYGHHQVGPEVEKTAGNFPIDPRHGGPIVYPHDSEHIAEGPHHGGPMRYPHEHEHIGENPHHPLSHLHEPEHIPADPHPGHEVHHGGPIGHQHDHEHIADDVAASTHELASEIKHAAEKLEDTAAVVEEVGYEVEHIANSEEHHKPECYHRSILERLHHAVRRVVPVLQIKSVQSPPPIEQDQGVDQNEPYQANDERTSDNRKARSYFTFPSPSKVLTDVKHATDNVRSNLHLPQVVQNLAGDFVESSLHTSIHNPGKASEAKYEAHSPKLTPNLTEESGRIAGSFAEELPPITNPGNVREVNSYLPKVIQGIATETGRVTGRLAENPFHSVTNAGKVLEEAKHVAQDIASSPFLPIATPEKVLNEAKHIAESIAADPLVIMSPSGVVKEAVHAAKIATGGVKEVVNRMHPADHHECDCHRGFTDRILHAIRRVTGPIFNWFG